MPADQREHDVLNEGVARPSPLQHANLDVLGRYGSRASAPIRRCRWGACSQMPLPGSRRVCQPP